MVTQARVSSSGDRAAKEAVATAVRRQRLRLEGGGGAASESESWLPSADELAWEGAVSYVVSWMEISVVVDFRGRGGGTAEDVSRVDSSRLCERVRVWHQWHQWKSADNQQECKCQKVASFPHPFVTHQNATENNARTRSGTKPGSLSKPEGRGCNTSRRHT